MECYNCGAKLGKGDICQNCGANVKIYKKIIMASNAYYNDALEKAAVRDLSGGLQLFDVPQILTNGTGDPMRSSMTLIMFLNKHLYSKNYGMAGALSVVLFFITGVLSLVVFKITGNDKRKG